ncbi:ATP-binding protein [Actinocorallia sp. B10E7]|uniref:ATP-binding protein n=1 Tax=Actinocorallia sp. B10E7 TaxID=3153558 RepID=UPI00325F8837
MGVRVGMSGDGGELNRWCEVFAVDGSAARKARWAVVAALREWGLERLVEDGRVVVSELVTNVFAHAGTETVEVGVVETLGDVRIEVWDGSGRMPVARAAGELDEAGRGWGIVAALSAACGVEPDGERGGKAAWARLSKFPSSVIPVEPGVGLLAESVREALDAHGVLRRTRELLVADVVGRLGERIARLAEEHQGHNSDDVPFRASAEVCAVRADGQSPGRGGREG